MQKTHRKWSIWVFGSSIKQPMQHPSPSLLQKFQLGKKKILTCTYPAVTVPTALWLPCGEGRAVRQQGSTPSQGSARVCGSRRQAGHRQGAGSWCSFPAAAPQCQTSVRQVNGMEVRTGWVCRCLSYREGDPGEWGQTACEPGAEERRRSDTEELGLPCFACATQMRRGGGGGGGQSHLSTRKQQN